MSTLNIPNINLPRVVIIGGGFGGINLAKALKNDPVQVVMLDKNNYHTFQPLLYQVATGGLEPDSIAFPLRKLLKGSEHFHFRLAEVKEIDPVNKVVFTNLGPLEADYIVVATGSKTNFFGNAELESRCQGMKSIPEALDLRSLILQNFEAALLEDNLELREGLMNFVVVGGGPTGVETAGALAELKRHVLPADYPELDLRRMQIHLLEAGPALLSGMSAQAGKNALQELRKMGVTVWLSSRVNDCKENVVSVEGGKKIQSTTVIWSAGVSGNPIPGLCKEYRNGNRVEVDEFNRVKGESDVFAIGDVAFMQTAEFANGHPQVAQPAIQQGKQLARNILNLIYGKPLRPFVYKDLGSMATIGRNKAVADISTFRFSGRLAWLMWMGVHLFALAGFRNRLVVFINWFWSYITYDRGTRLIIRPFKRKTKGMGAPNPALAPEPIEMN